MTTPELWRAELLRDIWNFGPTSTRLLLQRGKRSGRTAAEAEADLAHLETAGLIHAFRAGRGPECYGPALDAEEAARREYARLTECVTCRTCGCSDNWPCPEGCFWVEDTLCTSCAEMAEVKG